MPSSGIFLNDIIISTFEYKSKYEIKGHLLLLFITFNPLQAFPAPSSRPRRFRKWHVLNIRVQQRGCAATCLPCNLRWQRQKQNLLSSLTKTNLEALCPSVLWVEKVESRGVLLDNPPPTSELANSGEVLECTFARHDQPKRISFP